VLLACNVVMLLQLFYKGFYVVVAQAHLNEHRHGPRDGAAEARGRRAARASRTRPGGGPRGLGGSLGASNVLRTLALSDRTVLERAQRTLLGHGLGRRLWWVEHRGKQRVGGGAADQTPWGKPAVPLQRHEGRRFLLGRGFHPCQLVASGRRTGNAPPPQCATRERRGRQGCGVSPWSPPMQCW